jgi:formamidopyrimidine-DNA glycosylase
MPELPEVETVANGVNARIRGQRIHSVWFSRHKEPFKTPPAEMADSLTGKRIERVYRIGKHIVFDLVSRHGEAPALQWIVHLGMTGRLLVSASDVPVPAHTHAILQLDSNRELRFPELRFVDPRRFGRMALHRIAPAQPSPAQPSGRSRKAEPSLPVTGGFRGPGSEPLSISPDEFIALFRNRKLSIKAALLNQKLLHGVGNIYADESLFHAGIHPTRIAGRIRRERLFLLHTALQSILRKAIELGGSSVSDYVDADGVAGFFQLEHRVYMRTGQPCLVCGSPIRRMVVAGRGTHYCPHCQK